MLLTDVVLVSQAVAATASLSVMSFTKTPDAPQKAAAVSTAAQPITIEEFLRGELFSID